MSTYLSLARCEFPYEAQTEDELTVEEDQILWVLEDDDPEWYKVKIRTEADNPGVGLVPASYLTTPTLLRSTVALYDYVPARTDSGELENEEELEMTEGEKLSVWEDEGDWILVGRVDGKGAGFVPASYLEGGENVAEDEEEEAEPAPTPVAYVEPAERVATSKAVAKGGDVKTWSVTEIDKKKKKKKGTLGVGNGAVFFASESDKTPVQQYPLSSLADLTTEKSKHIHLTFPTSGELHFVINTKEAFDEIMSMIDAGRGSETSAATPSAIPSAPPAPPAPAPPPAPPAPPPPSAAAIYIPPPPPIRTVSAAAPSPTPPARASTTEPDGSNGDAEALYDFVPQGDDELAVTEGDRLVFIHGGSDDPEWVKVRKVGSTEEGVVPASYVQLDEGTEEGENGDDSTAREAEEAAAAADAAALAAQLKADKRAAADREAKVKADRDAKEKQKRDLQATEAARRKRLESQPTAAPIPIPQPGEEGDAPPKVGARPSRSEVAGSSRSNGKPTRQPTSKPQPHKVRTWKDRTGQFKVEAEFLGLNGNKIRLHKLNGVIIEVPVEKMSPDDTAYLKRAAARLAGQDVNATRQNSEDRRSRQPDAQDPSRLQAGNRPPPTKKKQTDWFEFFLNAGVDVDDCTRYANNFEREKVEEGLLAELESANLRSLGLREGDIIRVLKYIKEKYGPPPTPEKTDREAQIAADALMARSLQGPTPPPPNLFSQPDGRLRGRRQTTSRAAGSVDSAALAAAGSELAKQRGTPPIRVESPTSTTSTSLDPSRRSSSTKPLVGGFDDDAWTVKTPSKPSTPAPPPAPVAIPAPPPAPTAPTPPPAPPAATPLQPASVPQRPGSAVASKLTYEDGVLAGLAARPPSAPIPQTHPTGGSFASMSSGGGSFIANGPRAPIAPIAANQGLLAPLIPTQTGMPNFAARPQFSQAPLMPAMTGFQGMPLGGLQPNFTGMPMQASSPFGGMNAPLQMQPTGAPAFMQPQPTGIFQQPQLSFQQAQPTGFQPQPPQQNFNPAPARFTNSPIQFNPTPPAPTTSSSAAANGSSAQFQPNSIFASMKDGSFAKGSNQLGPQDSNKYDALRPQPTGIPFGQGLQPQPTGFMQPQPTGFVQTQITGFPGQQQPQPMYPQQTGMFQQNGYGRQF